MRNIFQASILLCFLAACGAGVTSAPMKMSQDLTSKTKSAIAPKLRNPSSVQWGGMTAYQLSNREIGVCAMVNAQNGFGGMTGFKPVAVFHRGSQNIVLFDDSAAFECNNLARGISFRPA